MFGRCVDYFCRINRLHVVTHSKTKVVAHRKRSPLCYNMRLCDCMPTNIAVISYSISFLFFGRFFYASVFFGSCDLVLEYTHRDFRLLFPIEPSKYRFDARGCVFFMPSSTATSVILCKWTTIKSIEYRIWQFCSLKSTGAMQCEWYLRHNGNRADSIQIQAINSGDLILRSSRFFALFKMLHAASILAAVTPHHTLEQTMQYVRCFILANMFSCHYVTYALARVHRKSSKKTSGKYGQ